MTVPTLNVAGWWDQEDFYGPLKIYETLEKHDTKHLNYLVVGPWNHGGWSGASGDRARPDRLRQRHAQYYPREHRGAVVRLLAQGQGQARPRRKRRRSRPARTSGSRTTAGRRRRACRTRSCTSRRTASSRSTRRRETRDGVRRVRVRSGESGAVPRAADPADVRPGRRRGRGGWSTISASPSDRPDVLSWRPSRSTEDVAIAGHVTAHLFASTTGTDADWVVKLIDVYPEKYEQTRTMGGYQLMVANDVFARPVPQELREAGGDHAEQGRGVHDRPAHAELSRSRRGTGSWCRCRAPGSR